MGHQQELTEVALGEASRRLGTEEAVRVPEDQVQPSPDRDSSEAQGQR